MSKGQELTGVPKQMASTGEAASGPALVSVFTSLSGFTETNTIDTKNGTLKSYLTEPKDWIGVHL